MMVTGESELDAELVGEPLLHATALSAMTAHPAIESDLVAKPLGTRAPWRVGLDPANAVPAIVRSGDATEPTRAEIEYP
jgi:hypothetical protein